MGILRQIADPEAPRSKWIKYMHGINRISIFMFLFALLVILIRIFILKKGAH